MSTNSPDDLKIILDSLDAIKKLQICGVCGKRCHEPVVLKECFHVVCAQHEELKQCPNCKRLFENNFSGESYTDSKINRCFGYTVELDRIFNKFRAKDVASTSVSNINATEITSNQTDKVYTNQASSSKKPITNKTNAKKLVQDKTSTKKAASSKTITRQDLSDTLGSNVSSVVRSNEKRNNKGETALHVACRLGNIEKAKELLALGANVNTKDNAGWTPLHEVVQNGRLDLVLLLLQYNTLINVPGQGNETPLHEAVRYHHKKIAEELVKHGADINVRNCKGETPYQLASINMKNILLTAADNVLHTQSVNISHISALYESLEFYDIHIYCTSQYRTMFNKLKLLSKHHSNITIESTFNKRVTHIIVDEDEGVCQSSFEVLQAIVNHVCIISTEWLTKSSETKLEQFQQYEVKGIGTLLNNGPRNSRYNKYKQLPGIFNGCHFYLHNFNNKYEISKTLVLTKAILSKLITDAGGIVLRRVPNPELIPETEKLVPYHASKGSKLYNCSHYIIFKDMFEPMYNMQHLKALPIGWLIKCLEKYELCDPE